MREVDRVGVIREVLGRRLRQGEASERLGICVRQVKRLVRRYREEGARGLRSRRRGRRASNGIAQGGLVSGVRRFLIGSMKRRLSRSKWLTGCPRHSVRPPKRGSACSWHSTFAGRVTWNKRSRSNASLPHMLESTTTHGIHAAHGSHPVRHVNRRGHRRCNVKIVPGVRFRLAN